MICPATPCDIVTGTHCRTLIDNLLESKRTVVAHLHLTFLTSLCGNENYTIGTAATIDSGRGSILKDVDALDVTRVQRLDTSRLEGHTIDNIEWSLVSRDRTSTTNPYATHCTRTLTCCDIHTGSLTLKCLKSIVYRLSVQLFFAYAGKSTGNVALTLNAITYYYHLVKHLLILFEGHFHLTLTSQGYRLCTITDVRDYKFGILWNIINGEVTFKVGNRAITCSLHNYTCADYCFTRSIDDSTGYFVLGGYRKGTHCEQSRKHQPLEHAPGVV